MSVLYTILLCVVFVAFIAVTVEAVFSVSLAKPWLLTNTRLALVKTTERRTQDLHFVGTERRASEKLPEAAEAQSLAA